MQLKKTSEYILAWALWAVTSVVGVLIGFWAVRGALSSIVEALTMGAAMGTPSQQFQVPFTRNAVDRFAILTLGLLSVLLVVGVEYYYRTGVDVNQLWRRFVQVTAIESGVLFVALTIQVIFLGVLGLFTIWSVLLPLAVLALTVGLSWILTRLPKKPSPA